MVCNGSVRSGFWAGMTTGLHLRGWENGAILHPIRAGERVANRAPREGEAPKISKAHAGYGASSQNGNSCKSRDLGVAGGRDANFSTVANYSVC